MRRLDVIDARGKVGLDGHLHAIEMGHFHCQHLIDVSGANQRVLFQVIHGQALAPGQRVPGPGEPAKTAGVQRLDH
ncbi:hypothetical protein D3C87_1694840 [compost metagenome]